MVTKGNAFLPSVSVQQLRVLSRRENLRKPQLRLLAALRRKQGWTVDRIAESLEQPLMTVHGWLSRLEQRGINALQDKKQTGRPARLTLAQKRQLIRDLERGPPHNATGLWSTKEVRELLLRKYGVTFVNQHVWRMLDQLGFSMLRPRKAHHRRADAATIAAFKKKRDDWCASTSDNILSSQHKTKQPSA
jgi:transposase